MLRVLIAALSSATRYIAAFPLVVGELALTPFRWMAWATMPAPSPALEAVGVSAALAVSSDAVLDAEAEQRRREREARRAQAYGMPTAHASVAAGPIAQAAIERVARRPRNRQSAPPPTSPVRAQPPRERPPASNPEIEAKRASKASAIREALAGVGIEVADEAAESIMDKCGSGPRLAPGPRPGM